MSPALASHSNCLMPGYWAGWVLCGRAGAQLERISGAAVGGDRVPGGRAASIFAGDSAADRGAAGSSGPAAHIKQNQALSEGAGPAVATAPSQRGAGTAENRAFQPCRRLIDNLQTLAHQRAGSASCAAPRGCKGEGGATPSQVARASDIPSRTLRPESGKTGPKPIPTTVGIDRAAVAKGGRGMEPRGRNPQRQLGSGVRVARNKASTVRNRGRLAGLRCGLSGHVSFDLRRGQHQARERG